MMISSLPHLTPSLAIISLSTSATKEHCWKRDGFCFFVGAVAAGAAGGAPAAGSAAAAGAAAGAPSSEPMVTTCGPPLAGRAATTEMIS